MNPTNVYLTIDTECTEERLLRGRIRPPLGYELMMWGRFRNQRRPLGIEWIIGELARYRMAATFFVEALCADVFGHGGLAEVCSYLLACGQDVQLHLHPNLRRPAWRATGGQPLCDNIGEYPIEEQTALLRDGLAHLERCGVPPDTILGFRAGNYGAANSTWEAMRRIGIVVDSSLNLRYLGKDCSIEWPNPEIDLFQPVPGVWELPVANFREGGAFRHLEITAVSAAEMAAALLQAQRNGVRHVTIVAHPAEFFVIDSADRKRGRPNRINMGRFRKLLQFLAINRDAFAVHTVGQLGRAIKLGVIDASVTRPPVALGSRPLRTLRMLTQVVKRIDNRFGLA